MAWNDDIQQIMENFESQKKTNGVRHVEWLAEDQHTVINILTDDPQLCRYVRLTRFWDSEQSAQQYLAVVPKIDATVSRQISTTQGP
jgi:hypothetical protein